jgi:hypothetical protein
MGSKQGKGEEILLLPAVKATGSTIPKILIALPDTSTYIRAPPYLGAPKFANAISKPPGYLLLASGGNVICKSKGSVKLI